MRAVSLLVIVAAIAFAGWYFFLRDGGGVDLVAGAQQAQEAACAAADSAAAQQAMTFFEGIGADAIGALGDEAAGAFNSAKEAAQACVDGGGEGEAASDG